MNVSLSDKWDNFVKQQVDSGSYSSNSEVVRAGLRLLENEKLALSMKLISSTATWKSWQQQIRIIS